LIGKSRRECPLLLYFSDDDAPNADKLEEILISLLNFPGGPPEKSGRKWDPYYFSDDDAPNATSSRKY